MTDQEYSEWLTNGEDPQSMKIEVCIQNATDPTLTLERIGKSICHLLYRAIDGVPFDHDNLIRMTGSVLYLIDNNQSETKLQRSRWLGSVSIALAYFLIIKTGRITDSIVILDSMMSLEAIGHHPQNVLNIQRSAMLLAAIHIQRGDKATASVAIQFAQRAFRKACGLVNFNHGWIGLLDELHRWVNAIGVGVSLGACVGDEVLDSPLVFDVAAIEPQRPFKTALLAILQPWSTHNGVTDRRGLSAMFYGDAVELGVAAGSFSRMILENGRCARLYSVDRWSDHHDSSEYWRAAHTLLSVRPGACIPLRMTFDEALPMFADQSLDCIYIDGYASGGQVGGKTLRDWWTKLKPGGLFSGHDYHPKWQPTIDAVDAFAKDYNFSFSVTGLTDEFPSWYGRKPLLT